MVKERQFSSTHAQRLERWLGAEQVERVSESMKLWHGPPIALAGTPGAVFAMKGGDFCGPIKGGGFANFTDFAVQRAKRILRNCRGRHYAGFASLADLLAEMNTGGKMQTMVFTKTTGVGAATRHNSLFNVGAVPAAGGVGGTAGTGRKCVRSTTGALGQMNAATGDQLHLTTVCCQSSNANQMLLLYDRLWDMTHTMTVDPQSCDAANPPDRYQTAALAPGNFISGEVTTVLPAATPTVTFDYVDQDGNNVTGPALSTIESGAGVNTVPFTAGPWFYPIDPTDQGVRSLQNSANAVDLSAAMASGVVTWFIGHPLCYVPAPTTSVFVILDGINSAFNLQRIYDDACLCLMELAKASSAGTTWCVAIQMVSG